MNTKLSWNASRRLRRVQLEGIDGMQVFKAGFLAQETGEDENEEAASAAAAEEAAAVAAAVLSDKPGHHYSLD
jgi:hypothetical protein